MAQSATVSGSSHHCLEGTPPPSCCMIGTGGQPTVASPGHKSTEAGEWPGVLSCSVIEAPDGGIKQGKRRANSLSIDCSQGLLGCFKSLDHYYAMLAYSTNGITWFNSPNTAIPLMCGIKDTSFAPLWLCHHPCHRPSHLKH